MDQDNGQMNQEGQANPQINTSPEFKHDIQNPTGSFPKVEKHKAGKSNDFLLTLTAIMFISGGYAVWFFLNLPSEIEAETVYVPIRHNNTVGMMASSTASTSSGQADMSDWKTYRNEKTGFEIKLPPEWSYMKCLNDVQNFFYADGKLKESCDSEIYGYYSDISIIGPLSNATTTYQPHGFVSVGKINIGGINVDLYKKSDKSMNNYRNIDMYEANISNNSTVFDLRFKSDGDEIKQILSTFKFTK